MTLFPKIAARSYGPVRTSLAIGLAGILAWTGPAFGQGVDFSGKTVKIMINFGTGSATDATTRQFAPFVGKHLPGKPKLIIEAKPGGRGKLGAAFVFKNVKPDGMTLGGMTTLIGRWAMGEKMPVDLEKFVHAGAFGGSPVVYVRKDTGIRSLDDLKTHKKMLIAGATAPNTTAALPIRLFLRSVAPQAGRKIIAGYRGQLGMYKAMRSGEVNVAFLNSNLWMQRRKGIEEEGKFVALVEYGVPSGGKTVKTPGLNIPTVAEAWRKLIPGAANTADYKAAAFVQESRGATFHYGLPPGTPKKFAKVWGNAMKKGLSDPGYLAILKKTNAPPPIWSDADEVRRVFAAVKVGLADKNIQKTLKSEFVKK